MITGKFSIHIDDKGDRHVHLPYRELKVPDVEIDRYNPCVDIRISDFRDVLEAHVNHNQRRVNEILKTYY